MVWPTPSFNPSDQYHLYELLAQARRPAPDGWLPVHLGSRPLGLISSERAMVLSSWLPLVKYRWGWEWQADHLTARARSEQLRWAACALRDAGMISGWRNEAYASWGPVGVPGDVNTQELFRLERAAFGYFGFRSHAVHVNGFTQDGRVWRAKRAWTKATDPGMGDNLAAGGLSAGETVMSCAWRELQEEAGLTPSDVASLTYVGSIVTEQLEPEGWHSEPLQVFNAVLMPGTQPVNQDGEVQSFICLTPDEVMESLRQKVWTVDASCAMALAWCAPRL